MSDAVRALLHPFASGMLVPPGPGRAFLLRAEADPELDEAWRRALVCQQTFKPSFDRLRGLGFRVETEIAEGGYDVGLVVVTKHKAETFANIARGWALLRPGGMLVCAGGNDVGAGSVVRDVKAVLGEGGSCAKHHCKVSWTIRTDQTPLLVEAWVENGKLRLVPETGCWSRPGIYNWDKIDRGSALLAASFPDDLGGRVADFGAGWGYLAKAALAARPAVRSLDLFEAELLAIEAAKANLRDAGVPVGFHWKDLAAGASVRGFDWVVMNPPFHSGKATDVDLGRAFIAAAAQALAPGGRLLMVANRHLPYETVVDSHFARRRIVAQDAAFKVIEAAT